MSETLAEKVLAALWLYGLKKTGANEYRVKEFPGKPGSDSNSMTLTIDSDDSGAFMYHAGGEGGSLYDLARILNIEIPANGMNANPSPVRSIAEYAAAHGVPVDVLQNAGWKETTYWGKRALEFPTTSGKRWRLLEGGAKYISTKGYKACWYGLKSAIAKAQEIEKPVILCNGEISTVVGTHYGLPVFTITSGEKAKVPDALIDQFKTAYPSGTVLIAYDCDVTGRTNAPKLAAHFKELGYQSHAIDLQLTDGADVADYCKLHGADAPKQIFELPELTAGTDKIVIAEVPQSEPPPSLLNYEGEAIMHGANRLTRRNDSISKAAARALGQKTIEHPPLIQPLAALHHLRGQALITKPGKMCGIWGMSGGLKTTLMEVMAQNLAAKGERAMFWGPEWTNEDMGERDLSRQTGVSGDALLMQQIAISRKQKGLPPLPGITGLSDAQKKAINDTGYRAKTKSSLIYDLENPTLTLSELKDLILALRNEAQEHMPRVLFIDYLQVLHSNNVSGQDRDGVYTLLQRLKTLTVEAGVYTVIASQTRKMDGETSTTITNSARRIRAIVLNVAKNSRGDIDLVRLEVKVSSGGISVIDRHKPELQEFAETSKYLDAFSGRYASPDPFNLLMTITPEYM
jgi:hypothetical protein